MFPDGTILQYSSNLFTEYNFEKLDENGHNICQCMDEILDHKRTKETIPKPERNIISKNDQKKKRITCRGWEFLVKWKSG